MDMEPGILFEDNHCLIIDKPAGLATQAPEPFPSLESWARNYLKQKYNKAGRPYLGIPHRLDRPVSGRYFLPEAARRQPGLLSSSGKEAYQSDTWHWLRV